MSRSSALGRGLQLPLGVQLTAIMGATALTQGVAALLMARWLGASDRGVVAVVQSVSLFSVLVGSLGLIASTRVLLSSPSRGVQLSAFLRATRPLTVLQLVLATSLGWLAVSILTGSTGLAVPTLFVLFTLLMLRASLLREALHGVGWHRSAGLAELIGAFTGLAGMFGLHVVERLDVVTALCALVVGAAMQWLLQATSLRRALHVDAGLQETTLPAPPDSLLTRMVRFSRDGLGSTVAAAVAGRIDRIVLAALSTTAAVGTYATAATMADVPWVLPIAIAPMIVRATAACGDTSAWKRWYPRVLGATAALAIVVLAGGALVLENYLGPDFRGTWPLLAVLLLGCLPMASQQVDLAICTGLGDLRTGLRSSTVSGAAGLLAYLALTPPWGAMGCAIGTVVAYTVGAVIAFRGRRAHTREIG